MPTFNQYATVKQQCKSFQELNCIIKFNIQSQEFGFAPKIIVMKYFKNWHFSDPDWNIVIKQLAQFYKFLKKDLKYK